MGVIDRVHRHTTDSRANSTPTHGTSLANFAQTVFFVTHLSDRRTTLDMNAADFTGAQPYLRIGAFTRQKLN
jgi:hypothetical protein